MKHPPQEPEVISGRSLVGVGIGVVLATTVGVLIAIGIGAWRSHTLHEDWVPRVQQIDGDQNGIETRPFTVEAQGLEQHARESAWLQSYGWTDRARKLAHVPIDVAIDLYLSTHGARK